MSFKTISAGTYPLATDVDQFRQVLSGSADVGTLSLCPAQSTPSAPSVAPSGVGNLNGTYYYKVVLITGFQQADGSFWVNGFVSSTDSAQLTVANGQCALTSIPLGSAGTIGRALYRTIAGGSTGLEKYAFVIWDNVTTSFTDNVLDGVLGTNMPNSSSIPASYGTAIPSTPPGTNSTGTTLTVSGGNAATVNGHTASGTPNTVEQTNLIGMTNEINTNLSSHLTDYVRNPGYAVTTGGTTAYVVSTTPAPTSYIDGMGISVKINVASTGATTLNWNGLGAKPIYDSLGNAVTNLLLNTTYSLKYESVNGRFIVLGKGGGGNAGAGDLLIGKTATVDTGQITGALALTGTAGVGDVASGKTFYNTDAKTIQTGIGASAKRYATGPVTSNSGTLTFTTNAGVTPARNYVTVSGLTFQPSTILVVSPSVTTIFKAGQQLAPSGVSSPIIELQLNADEYVQLTGNAYVNSTSFQLPVLTGNVAMTWFAYE
jgi:hypothetical protein